MQNKILFSFSFLLVIGAICQSPTRAQNMQHTYNANGTISGTIFVKQLSGSVGSQLTCNAIIIAAFDTAKKPSSLSAAYAKGDIVTGKCSYVLDDIAANIPFTIVIPKPDLFKKCDNSVFLTSRTSVLTIADGAKRTINMTIREAGCSQVK